MPESEIERLEALVRKLEAELDAATRLSEVRVIARELRLAREALKRARDRLKRR